VDERLDQYGIPIDNDSDSDWIYKIITTFK
jgi:hypothetical protein